MLELFSDMPILGFKPFTALTVLPKIGLLLMYLSAVFFLVRVCVFVSMSVFYYYILGLAQRYNFEGLFLIALGRIFGTFKLLPDS